MRKPFLNLWVSVVALWLLVVIGLITRGTAQMTAPLDVVTETTNPEPKEFTAENDSGAPIVGAYLAGDPDTLKPLWLTGTVDQVIDSTHVQLGITMRYGGISINRSITVTTSTHFWLPSASWDGIPANLVRIAPNDTTWAKGWQFKIQVRELSNKLLPRTVTLISAANVSSSADSVTGSATRADFGTLSLELTAAAADSDSCQVRLLGQMRLRNGEWTGPPTGGLYVLADSLVLVPGATLKLPISLPAAEWFRPVVAGNSWTGNVTVTALKARLN